MELVLDYDKFENDKLFVAYGGNKQAMFTVVSVSFEGENNIGTIEAVTCAISTTMPDGSMQIVSSVPLVIGIGDGKVGVRSSVVELRGKQLTKYNMGDCVVILYEE